MSFHEPPIPASYIILKETIDTTEYYYAINGKTGETEFGGLGNVGGVTGTDASSVIQATINALTNGGKIFIKTGTYVIKTTLKLINRIALCGEGFSSILKLGTANINLIENSDQINGNGQVIIQNLVLDGDKATLGHTSNARGIYWSSPSGYFNSPELTLTNLKIQNFIRGLDIRHPSDRSFISKVEIDNTDEVGLYLMASDCLVSQLLTTRQGYPFGVGWNLYLKGGANTFINCYFGGSARPNVYIEGNYNKFIGVTNDRANRIGYQIVNSIGTQILGGRVSDSGYDADDVYSGISIEGTSQYTTIQGVTFKSGQTNKPRYWISESGSADYAVIQGNTFRDFRTQAVYLIGANSRAKYNLIGYATESSGTATIIAGNTSVDVEHKLAIVPDINKIEILPKDNLLGRDVWVESHPTLPETYFVIKMSSSDTIDHEFGWRYG